MTEQTPVEKIEDAGVSTPISPQWQEIFKTARTNIEASEQAEEVCAYLLQGLEEEEFEAYRAAAESNQETIDALERNMLSVRFFNSAASFFEGSQLEAPAWLDLAKLLKPSPELMDEVIAWFQNSGVRVEVRKTYLPNLQGQSKLDPVDEYATRIHLVSSISMVEVNLTSIDFTYFTLALLNMVTIQRLPDHAAARSRLANTIMAANVLGSYEKLKEVIQQINATQPEVDDEQTTQSDE